MKLTLIIFVLIGFVGFAQTDTLLINLNSSTLTYRQIKSIYFMNRQSSLTISEMDSLDKAFESNEDTIYIQLYKGNDLLIEGQKLPRNHAFGVVRFYKKGRLVKTENWLDGIWLKSASIEIRYGGESGFIATKVKYKKNFAVKKIERKPIVNSRNKSCIEKQVYKMQQENKWKLIRTTQCHCSRI